MPAARWQGNPPPSNEPWSAWQQTLELFLEHLLQYVLVSATICFILRFSSSNCLRRLSSLIPRPPYFFFQPHHLSHSDQHGFTGTMDRQCLDQKALEECWIWGSLSQVIQFHRRGYNRAYEVLWSLYKVASGTWQKDSRWDLLQHPIQDEGIGMKTS